MRSGDDGQVPAPGGNSRDGTGAESRAASPLSQELGCQQHIRQHLWITWDRSQAPAPPFPEGSQGQESLGMLAQPPGGEMGPAGAAQDTGKLSSWERGDEPAPSPNPNFPNRSFRGVLMSSFPFLAWSGSGTLGMHGQGVTGPAGRHPNPPALLQAPSPHSAAFPSGESIKKTVIESQVPLFLGKTP